ncbi:uncharacterized protein LOC135462870 [Liolophura sinensis]|uniref:uncharacterized protein LOC135462870 n=1 Tax=Liolophura sinensis TaxID=3198878 RepID=UPI00315821A3
MKPWLLVILFLVSGTRCIQGASLDEKCQDDSECAVPNTACKTDHCLGSTCQCNMGYRLNAHTRQCDKVVCSSTTFNPPSTSTSKSASSTTSTRSTLSSASTVHPSTTAGGTTTTVPPVLIGQKCTNVTKCADPRALCRPHRCDGMVCQCDVGYITNARLNICEKASLIREPCNKTTDCLPRHSVCNSKNVCECDNNFRATSDNFWCIGTGYKALGDICTTGDKCGIGADCKSSKCACVKWHAPWGKEEKWFGIPVSRFSQCENTNATLNECNGTTFCSTKPVMSSRAGLHTSVHTRRRSDKIE